MVGVSSIPMGQTVVITATAENVGPERYDHTISVEDLLSGVAREEYLATIRRVSGLDVPNTGCIEFAILWRRLTNSRTNNLVRAILFAQQLESRLDELGITRGTLVCGESLEEPYVRVVEDIAEGESLKTKQQDQTQSLFPLSILVRLFVILLKMGAILGDWFIARLSALVREPAESSIVYIPPIERLGSTLPVIESLDTDPQTVIAEPFWYYILQSDVKSQLASYSPTILHRYLSALGFIGQIRDLGTIFREVLTTHSFAPALVDSVEAEFGVRIDTTVRSIVRDNLSNLRLIRSLVLQRPLQAMFAADQIEKVVIGTLDPTGRAVVQEASKHDIQLYHIPHSIATTRPPYPKTDVIQFVAGEWDVQYYERVVPRDRWWRWVKVGRPYLSDLATQYGENTDSQSTDSSEHDRLRVVLATQPFSLRVRTQFVETMLASLGSDRFEVTIKPHPDESVGLYEDLTAEYENVRVIRDGLYEAIVASDLTVTISSNVGLESIIIGTPTVCFNAWEPFRFEQTYASAEEIPVLRSEATFQAFVNQLDSNEISQLWSQQQAFVEDTYILESNITADIANYIESDPADI